LSYSREIVLNFTISQPMSYSEMKCSNCGFELSEADILKAAASIIGSRGRGASKARDSKKMSRAGKKGGWPKGKPRGKRVAVIKEDAQSRGGKPE
jgi:hypothetical protein